MLYPSPMRNRIRETRDIILGLVLMLGVGVLWAIYVLGVGAICSAFGIEDGQTRILVTLGSLAAIVAAGFAIYENLRKD